MIVRELVDFLNRHPPHTPVLVRDFAGTLEPAMPPEKTTALLGADGDWLADEGEDVTPEATYGKRCDVVVLG